MLKVKTSSLRLPSNPDIQFLVLYQPSEVEMLSDSSSWTWWKPTILSSSHQIIFRSEPCTLPAASLCQVQHS